ncbi:hypothetical protein HCN51_34025 [Nonomuraea sp. FMUSA5-5]|uniref:Cyanovirin-N domain-containing protein n=1 Tax=Nonomuraea composti TaxID=2720023 RepID=A0ABX1BGG6_9ACTN|nr:hypothetical protein [Nonomuraea sp. FMUSA5-5]NJP94401.1 hypothetical protein [Nonomuraea sp. FMUSA5-5]
MTTARTPLTSPTVTAARTPLVSPAVSTARTPLLALSVAALVLTLSAPLPARAAGLPPIIVPTYTCDSVRGDPGRTVLFGNCSASLGAVTDGDFAGEAIGAARDVSLRIKCADGGTAAVPDEVALQTCTRTR